MIEDDLRGLIDPETEVEVYARLIPLGLPECIVLQEIGGRTSTAGIRRNYRTVSVMAVSSDRETAGQRMRWGRNFLTENIPAYINGTHYYKATPLADGTLLMKARNGPRYITYCDMEVECSL